MALSLLCGGLGVAEATVHVDEVPSGAKEVYTIDETYTQAVVNAKLDLKADKTDVATNTANIANNKTDITKLENEKLRIDVASATYATKTELSTKADAAALGEYAKTADVNTELANKADKTYVDTELTKKADVTALGEYAKTADVNTELANKADQADLDTANGKITDLQNKTAKLSPDGTKLTDMTTVETGTLKVTGGISNDTGVTTTLTDIDNSMKQTATNTGEIANLKTKTDGQQTAINGLNEKTTQISYDAANHITSVNGMKVGQQVDMGGKDIINAGALTATGKVTGDGVEAGTGAITGGSLTVTGKVTGNGVDAGTGDITTRGNVNGATLETTGNATIGGALTATGKVTGDGVEAGTGAITGGSLTVTGKVTGNGVDAGAGAITGGSLSVTGDTSLKKTDVNGALNVTGESSLKNTTVDGTLSVNKETTLNGKLTAKDEATFKEKVTMEKDLEVKGELKTDKISMKNTDTDAAGKHDSSTAITADYITHYGEVEKSGVTTKSSFTHTEEGSETYAYKGDATDWTETRSDVKADGVKTEVKDSKGNRTNTSQTTEVINGFAIDKDGNSSTTSQTAKDINGNVTDKDGNKTDMKVTATENSIQIQDKDGKNTNLQVNKMGSSVTEIKNAAGATTKTEQTATDITNTAEQGTIKNNAMNIENNASGNITNNAQNGTITNNAKDIVNNATGDMTNDVGGKLTTTVKGQATEDFKGGLDTTVTGAENHTVTGKQTNTIKNGQENIISGGQTNTITGGQINNITGDQTTIVTNGNISNKAENITNEANTKLTDKVGENTRETTSTSITDTVGTANRKIEDGKITDTAGDSTVTTENEKGTTFAKNGSAAYSTKAGAPTDTNIAGNLITTGRVDANELGVSDEDGANTADLSVKAGEGVKASAGNGTTTGSLDVTADEVSSTVKDASGKGSTFKQRIDAIMMESKDVSIKAEETLTNEAKVITNKASEVINNEAININNTAKGIITSKASEIKNQADKLISNKVGENTWENMEDGKITTSIKDGAKQNLTQSNAAGTTQSTVDGAKSTVTIQNADGLTGAVTDGRNTSVQNQTASAIATDVKDGAGNENASVANATTSANTITNGTKANTVISTADGTSFINSEATAPVTGASGAGTADRTTIKGNTITTGKVKMDYAEVMKDLGVHGSAKVDNNLEVVGTSTLTGDVTMENNATVKKNLAVGGNANITGDVTANSYKVGDKTYISAAGINANDQKITNVADGSISEGSKDAVNGGQLYGVKRDLEHQVDKVGANAAAMANLRPMEFDPSSKWNIAAAIGNYGSETAAALGAFYRPNDNVMVNLSTAFGTGENMVGGGVSVRLGKGGNKLSREETNALKAQVADLTARMDALLSVLNPNMSKDFPDVPENHWAYEAVSRLAGNDIVQGYPDGEFHGERTMTRYEMAEIIYNALSRGAEAERELVEEFKPELQAMAASEKATAEKAEG